MKRVVLLKFFGYALCFLLVSLFGHLYEERADTERIKITGVEYEDNTEVIVELTGKVKYPGKYSVKRGTRVHSLIYMAGGIKDGGDPESVDADMIIFEPCTINVSEKTDYDVKARFSKGQYSPDNLCNINTATKDDLTNLPSIGDILAQSIINYRKVNGDFKDKSEIQNVDGIGKSKYENIKDIITVGGNG